jgi:hypothetical protein
VVLRQTTKIPDFRGFLLYEALFRTRTGDPLLTMEVLERHARTRAITRDTLSPANHTVRRTGGASRDVARVVSDVSVLCPRPVVCSYNRERGVRMRLITSTNSCPCRCTLRSHG